jgi:hypothetical protein
MAVISFAAAHDFFTPQARDVLAAASTQGEAQNAGELIDYVHCRHEMCKDSIAVVQPYNLPASERDECSAWSIHPLDFCCCLRLNGSALCAIMLRPIISFWQSALMVCCSAVSKVCVFLTAEIIHINPHAGHAQSHADHTQSKCARNLAECL